MTAAPAGDLAHRVAHRRRQLGLTHDEVARRAGMASAYLEYLERSPAVAISRGSLIRLATALETTVPYLRGGEVDRPPGPGRAGPHPRLDILTDEECAAHLAGGGIGRFAFDSERGPVSLPVNFRSIDGDIVFRTRTGGVLAKAAAAGTRVGFEVDRIDEAMSEGWSVLVSGRARLVTDGDELERISHIGIEPWPGGHREAVVRIEPAEVTGRRIRQRPSSRSAH